MSGRFGGKVVIITGSSSGIGQDAAVGFAKEGASVTIHGQSEAKLQETKKLINDAGIGDDRIQIVQGSLEDAKTLDELVNKTVEKFGRIDVLINNAGIFKHPDHDVDSPESFDHVFAVNVKSAVMLTKKAAPHLEKTKGNVINLPSVMYYSMSKAAMDHFTRNAANIYSPKGVRVNSFNPGLTRTPFRTRHGFTDEAEQGIQKAVGSVLPMRRAGEPAEMTAVLLFLASEQASFVTGAIWHADGGGSVTPIVPGDHH